MHFKDLFQIPKTYLFCALLRIVLTCLPQTGYIHPDEYFQSIEVIAEKSLNIKVNKPWEFNVTSPIRTITPPYLTVGLSFHILKLLNSILQQQFNFSLTSPYYIVVFPRFIFCCLSFIVDWSLYRICLANSEKSKSRCLILSTSYVMIIYATRTFSNAIELVLFSLLLYYVAESLIFSNINIRQREYINKRYKKAKTVVEKVKFHKLRLYLENDSLRNYFIIATITTAGFFNRPTFVAYAISPVFFWLYRGIGFKSIASIQFHVRTIVFLASTLPTIVLFVIIDSFFYGYLTWGEIGVLKLSIDNFVVTPWNFIKYNVNPINLAAHGLHSRYLHAFVNIPLLFNILAPLCYVNFLDLFISLLRSKYHYLPSVRSVRGLMTASIIFPVTLLSIFPHQEPRFLIPIILPIVYLYGPAVLPEHVDVVVKKFDSRLSTIKKIDCTNMLFKTWLAINVALALFYGFVHQGGIYRFASHLSGEMQTLDDNLNYEIVTSHVYSIPHSLFHEETYEQVFKRKKRVTLHEKGSADVERVLTTIKALLRLRAKTVSHFRYKLYLVIPETLVDNLMHRLSQHENIDLIPSDLVTFYPHLSTEALPYLTYTGVLLEPTHSLIEFIRSFGLTRIEFKLNSHD